MSLVLDASAILAWWYKEFDPSKLETLSEALVTSEAHVPQLWRIEVANVILTNVRRKRHTLQMATAFLTKLSAFRIHPDPETDLHLSGRTWELAVGHGLTTYDACYLELALRMKAPLATLDRALQTAATKEGVPLFWH